jgi:uridine phosphorylase
MKARITPDQVVRHHAKLCGISVKDIVIAPLLIVSWMKPAVERIARLLDCKPCKHWLYGDACPAHTGSVDGRAVSVGLLRVGAPATVMMLEEFIACGARTIIGLGYAGSLQPSLPIGSIIIPTECVSNEGTSAHYVDDPSHAKASRELVDGISRLAKERGTPVRAGRSWTTDAPYKEFMHDIERHQRDGVLGVDMETSAMYALAAHRKIRAANVLVVSDELWHDWNPAFGTPQLDQAMDAACDLVAAYAKQTPTAVVH